MNAANADKVSDSVIATCPYGKTVSEKGFGAHAITSEESHSILTDTARCIPLANATPCRSALHCLRLPGQWAGGHIPGAAALLATVMLQEQQQHQLRWQLQSSLGCYHHVEGAGNRLPDQLCFARRGFQSGAADWALGHYCPAENRLAAERCRLSPWPLRC